MYFEYLSADSKGDLSFCRYTYVETKGLIVSSEYHCDKTGCFPVSIRVITKLPNSEQSSSFYLIFLLRLEVL